jgi:ubiquinone/menaquinone biosynthesis C-methylase UbiE/uncharacterized protein YbaR (Trm112 family)
MESLVCPLCKGPLRAEPAAYCCDACTRRYPILCGIPDFRIVPDRWIPIDQDRRKGERLFEGSTGRDFAGMLELYWSLTPDVAPALVEKFQAHQLAEHQIGAAVLSELPAASGPLLDLGCSTGGFLIAASRRFSPLVGADVAFRWLVAGQVRLREAGVAACLICANAEYLPFPNNFFATVTANDLLEHAADPRPVFHESRRVLQASGVAYFSTNNRYSILPEPHVGVLGVGWLPLSWQSRYVALMTTLPYRHIRLRSRRELLRAARAAGFAEISAAPAPPSSAPGRLPRAQAAYNRLRASSVGSYLLSRLGPRLQLVCRK